MAVPPAAKAAGVIVDAACSPKEKQHHQANASGPTRAHGQNADHAMSANMAMMPLTNRPAAAAGRKDCRGGGKSSVPSLAVNQSQNPFLTTAARAVGNLLLPRLSNFFTHEWWLHRFDSFLM